jgi:hypothetical protein
MLFPAPGAEITTPLAKIDALEAIFSKPAYL